MLESYMDIRGRIAEQPKWFDCHGVPRYDDFHPRLSPNVYADEVLLFEIACQSCDARFLVEENWGGLDGDTPLGGCVSFGAIHYGDPPCWECAAGATMNSIAKRTVQFWKRDGASHDWVRVPELEGIDIEPEWAKDEF